MVADIDALATALAAQINTVGLSWHSTFTAVVSDKPIFSTEAIETLRVCVLPYGEKWTNQTRGSDKLRMRVDIQFLKRAGRLPSSGADPVIAMRVELRLLVRTVHKWIRKIANRVVPTYPTALMMESVVEVQDPEAPNHERDFMGQIQLFYEETVSNR